MSVLILISDVGKIASEFAVSDINKTLASTGDIYPGQNCACIIKEEAKNVLANLHWGFNPLWINKKMQNKLLINARAETLADKPTFRDAFQKRRCLIAADGFYEWSTEKNYIIFICKTKSCLAWLVFMNQPLPKMKLLHSLLLQQAPTN